MIIRARLVVAALGLSLAPGCAARTGPEPGVLLPSLGTSAPWPSTESVPILAVSAERWREVSSGETPTCRRTAAGPVVDHHRMLEVQRALWGNAPAADDAMSKLVSAAASLGSDSMQRMYLGSSSIPVTTIGAYCTEEGGAVHLNDTTLGPYDFLWARPRSVAGSIYALQLAAWSASRRELLSLWAPTSGSGVLHRVVVDRYVEDESTSAAVEFHQQTADVWIVAADGSPTFRLSPRSGNPPGIALARVQIEHP